MTTYKTKYRAYKERRKGEEIVVKVFGGYAVMTYAEYNVWKKQK
jgi:hypothetical protein